MGGGGGDDQGNFLRVCTRRQFGNGRAHGQTGVEKLKKSGKWKTFDKRVGKRRQLGMEQICRK